MLAAVRPLDWNVIDPLTGFLTLAAAATLLTAREYQAKQVISGSFVCSTFAVAALGLPAGITVVLLSEASASAIRRDRRFAVVTNLVASLGPTVVVAVTLAAAHGRSGTTGYYMVFAAAGVAAVLVNVLLLAGISAIFREAPFGPVVLGLWGVAPALAFGILLTVVALAIYDDVGALAAASVILAVLAFDYMVGLVIAARTEHRRADELAQQRGQLVAQALDAEDRERQVLAERLHDEAIQSLLAARQELDGEPDDTHEGSRAKVAVETSIEQLRGAIVDLHPAALGQAGLAEAIRSLGERHAARTTTRIRVEVDERVAGLADRLIFSIVRELLTNSLRHASASVVHVSIRDAHQAVSVAVGDDGCGMDEGRRASAVRRGHIGLASTAQRVEAVGGSLTIRTSPSTGTEVSAVLPKGRIAGLTPPQPPPHPR